MPLWPCGLVALWPCGLVALWPCDLPDAGHATQPITQTQLPPVLAAVGRVTLGHALQALCLGSLLVPEISFAILKASSERMNTWTENLNIIIHFLYQIINLNLITHKNYLEQNIWWIETWQTNRSIFIVLTLHYIHLLLSIKIEHITTMSRNITQACRQLPAWSIYMWFIVWNPLLNIHSNGHTISSIYTTSITPSVDNGI